MSRNVRVEIVGREVRIDRAGSSARRSLALRLWPALTVIVLAGGVSLRRVRNEDWPGLGPIGLRAGSPEQAVKPSKSPLKTAVRVLVRDREPFLKAVPPVPRPPRKPDPSSFPKLDDSKIDEPKAELAIAESKPIDPSEVRERLRLEALEKSREQEEASRFKREVIDWMKRDESRHQLERDRTLRERAEQDRREFHERLRAALKFSEDKAARMIVRASAEHRGEVAPRTSARLAKFLQSVNLRGLAVSTRIRRLRALGIPEPYILGEIARAQYERIGERNGPRSKAEAIVVAARLILEERPSMPAAEVVDLKQKR